MIKILFITNKGYFSEKITEYGIDIKPPFRSILNMLKVFRSLHLSSRLKFKNIWYNNYNNINDYDIIILAANEFTVSLSSYIEKKINDKSIRLIFWYWNPVKPKYKPNLVSSKWEKWTFDKEDSIRYEMKYNGTYYFPIDMNLEKEEIDVFFIGLDKGRYNELVELENIFIKFGLNTKFHIVSDKKNLIISRKYKPLISYQTVVKNISKSKAILELMQENQTGHTLRTMESLFLSKKLITNNKSIASYNFYKKENIFILGDDDLSKLKDFLEAPYQQLDPSIVTQYDFANWINRLINHLELNDEL